MAGLKSVPGWTGRAARSVPVIFRLENILTVVGTDMAVTVDLERMIRIVDGQPVPRVLRCTQVYRMESGRSFTATPTNCGQLLANTRSA